MGISITRTGYRLGSMQVSNAAVAANCGVTEESIVEKTGIERRWYLSEGESLLDLASAAVMGARGPDSNDVELLICATYAHDFVYPSLASRVAASTGIAPKQMFDLQSNCTGFLNALITAHDRMAVDRSVRSAIVVGAESNSPFINPMDVDAAMFWSDGAGAVRVVQSANMTGGIVSLAFHSNTDSNTAVRLPWVDVGHDRVAAHSRITQAVVMGGLATWRQATSGLPRVIRECLDSAGLRMDQIDHVVFHQANLRMIEYLTRKLQISDTQVIANVDQVGNLGAASIPVMLAQADRAGRFQPGDRVLMAAVGAGFTFIALIWEW